MIVDDEPIILSGIKFLIDWEKHDCTIIDTARNGKEALTKIQNCKPDIVLCDIKMPVMDGIELLKIVNQELPSIVFVMLSNLQEFQLAKEAISYRAVEYLLKSELEAPLLEEALEKAKKASDHRSALKEADRIKYYDMAQQKNMIHNACLELLFSPDPEAQKHTEEILNQHHMLDNYGLLYIPFNFSALPETENAAPSTASLTAWEQELATRVADSLFGENYLYIQTGQDDCLTMFVWGQSGNWEQQITLFSSKFASASDNITQIQPVVCPTPCFHGAGQLTACRDAYFQRIDDFYLYEDANLTMELQARPAFEPLGLTGIGSQLEAELNNRNVTGCTLLLEKALDRIQNTFHQKSQAIWLCNELYRSATKALTEASLDAGGFRQIKALRTRSQVLKWIETLKNSLTDLLYQNAGIQSKSVMLEKAKQYVQDHVEEQISLQDVANYICISPGYLSTLFKKQYNQSFVSYINHVKIEKACQLISSRQYLISEIAFRLGYENAYYFARVFRRYTGMSPSEWEKTHGKQ